MNLHSKNDELKSIVNHMDDFLFHLDNSGYILFANTSMHQRLGYNPSELIGKLGFDLVHPEDLPQVQFTFKKYMGKTPTHDLNIRLFKKNSKETVSIYIRASRLINAEQKVMGLVCCGRTMSKYDFETYPDFYPANKYKKLISNLPLLIWTVDKEGRTIYASPASFEILGYTPDEILEDDQFWEHHIHPKDYKSVETAWTALFQSRKPYNIKYRIETKEKTWIWVNAQSFGFYLENGEYFADGLLRDISNMQAIQERLNQAQKMEALGRFAGGISHDFNNILTTIRGFTELILSEDHNIDEIHDFAQEIFESTNRASKLTKDILMFSRKQFIETESIQLSDKILNSQSFLQSIAGEAIRIEYHLKSDLAYIKSDPNQIDQILMNLLLNAKESMMPEGGQIIIKTTNLKLKTSKSGYNSEIPPGEYVVLEIQDQGKGIDKEVYRHLFEPFFTNKPKGEGTGLGLSIVFGIMTQNNGYIQVITKKNEGSTFRFFFPANLQSPSKKISTSSLDHTLEHKSKKLLIIEDDQGVHQYLRALLEKNNYIVVSAYNGEEALQLIKETPGMIPFDYVISDIVMPKINGITIATFIKEKWPTIPIILISGFVENGFDDFQQLEHQYPKIYFLPKPIETKKILALLTQVSSP